MIGYMLLLTLSKIWYPQAKAMNTQGITPMVGSSLSLSHNPFLQLNRKSSATMISSHTLSLPLRQ